MSNSSTLDGGIPDLGSGGIGDSFSISVINAAGGGETLNFSSLGGGIPDLGSASNLVSSGISDSVSTNNTPDDMFIADIPETDNTSPYDETDFERDDVYDIYVDNFPKCMMISILLQKHMLSKLLIIVKGLK